MDALHYQELIKNLESCLAQEGFRDKGIYLFGHCDATLTLADELENRGVRPKGILDNSDAKRGLFYHEIPVLKPERIMEEKTGSTAVLIVTRFYEAMNSQLRKMGYKGQILKLVDYNSFAEYSLSEQTYLAKRERCRRGADVLTELENKYTEPFFIFCSFPALGDVYYCMSYLPEFIHKRGISQPVICLSSKTCGDVAALFGGTVEILPQEVLEAAIQAVLFLNYENAFIAHQDRPYPIHLHSALQLKAFSLEYMYRVGVFGLEASTNPDEPALWNTYPRLHEIKKDKAVILSPYAKSVTSLPARIWTDLIDILREKGYQLFTNISADEKPLPGTESISPEIREMKSVVEQAGMFIGIRSGLCEVIKTADCRKIALYPDYNYCDTKWKAIDIYALPEFENIVVNGEMSWKYL